MNLDSWEFGKLVASKGRGRKMNMFDICFAGKTRQLHIVQLMYLTVQPDLELRVKVENEEI